MRDFPLKFHKNAKGAAEAARCAGEQNRYWKMHNMLFENQKEIGIENIKEYAVKIGLNKENFDICLDNNRYSLKIKKDIEEGKKAGVTGTPAFFIGLTQKGSFIKGRLLKGNQPFETFEEQIDFLLNQKKN